MVTGRNSTVSVTVTIVVGAIVSIVSVLRRITGAVPTVLVVTRSGRICSDRICCGAHHGRLTRNYTNVSYRLRAVDILRVC